MSEDTYPIYLSTYIGSDGQSLSVSGTFLLPHKFWCIYRGARGSPPESQTLGTLKMAITDLIRALIGHFEL